MREVAAFQDESGRLHKNRSDCIEADFIMMVQRAWGLMPDQRDRGDPVAIARILASDTYRSSRTKLSDAIAWLEAQLASMRADAQCPQATTAVSPPLYPVCAKCGRDTGGEMAQVGEQIWCHPCADAVGNAGMKS